MLKEITWRQKFREVWLKEGDKKERFFHKMAYSHRRHNDITSLKINGVWVREGQDLKQGIVDAFQTLLTYLGVWRAKLEGLVFSKIDESEAGSLELHFTEEEVWTTLSELNGEKALGPDEYITAFWQFSWDFFKNDIVAVFKDFFEIGKFVRSLNSTFIVMIP